MGDEHSQARGRQFANCSNEAASTAITALLCAALGAVAVAAIGVYGVFHIAMKVAEGTGRSLREREMALQAAEQAASSGLVPMQPDIPQGQLPPMPAQRRVRLCTCGFLRTMIVGEQRHTLGVGGWGRGLPCV